MHKSRLWMKLGNNAFPILFVYVHDDGKCAVNDLKDDRVCVVNVTM